MPRITTIGAVILAAGLLTTLASCSATDGKADKPAPSASATAAETVYNTCEDGQATILASDLPEKKPFRLDHCKEVAVVGLASEGSTIELGAVERLVVEGDGTTISVGSAGTIIVPGSENVVTHGADAKVEDLGKGNTVTAK